MRFTDPSLSWRDRVRAFALELRSKLRAHPGLVYLMLGHPLDGPNARAVAGTLLPILAETGLATGFSTDSPRWSDRAPTQAEQARMGPRTKCSRPLRLRWSRSCA
ncbi:TetR/AcrR family transcriptional regulator C-terminal domain-containing protein [Amycolatopsis sp. cmx-11-51]|uniref:TetR/AcrR family transcriptional regulator C-terminal domain-containing protein n=1 Tax=unclassified Amycolatopsis TaxID=2618356 RepID=UPI0039E28325